MAILCIGEIVVDWLSFTPGEDFNAASQWYRALGGNSANVAIGLGRLGTHVRLLGKVGADKPGEFLKQTLEQEKVDCSFLVIDQKAPTAQCYMTTTESGEHHYYNWPQPHAADLLEGNEIPVDRLLSDTTAVHSTSISLSTDPRRSAVMGVLQAAKANNAVVSFDAGFSKDPAVREHSSKGVMAADLLKMNEPELLAWGEVLVGDAFAKARVESAKNEQQLKHSADAELARLLFRAVKAKALFVTLSARGSLVLTENETIFCPPHKVVAASEVGAGDAYVAGVLHTLSDKFGVTSSTQLSNLDAAGWQVVGRSGNIVGAFAATHPSAYSGMPTAEQLAAVLNQTRV